MTHMFHQDQLMDICVNAHTTPLYCGHLCVVGRVTFPFWYFCVENMTFIGRVDMINKSVLTVEVSREQDIGNHRQAEGMPCS